ncbi:MAG: carboxylating nicotinate-nucleotide diphosphorylase [Bacteroidales bacterium]|jgi:nicotinate-nucleotide pyrophosphorylase (carboxylating)|nr:carboxylating nicotinate-nucleotide diphosphorylase [Bacteroidales bacterium]MDD4384536.1 carboxylating nicotinate-nucleotide diphosphorylase [Bacteroidales bacterium]MDY0197467.1 carboxylating nicotinate-nucleotide diphosphorylase [Tenuifilaceae bacterium]
MLLEKLLEIAILEDIGDGDHSSLSCIPNTAQGEVKLMVKQQGIIAGVEIAEKVYAKIDANIQFKRLIADGKEVNFGDIVFSAKGKVHSLLQAERIVLNIMQRMSGIATQTRQYVDLIEGTKAKVLDTRKTTPGMRILDKMAVKIGGGENHRMGLYDMIMLKDNHVDFAGGITQAIDKANSYLKHTGKKLDIEVETRSIEEIKQVIAIGGVKRIMLDNFTPTQTAEAVKVINGRFETESSGGITLETIRAYAETGVDFISVGALTHQIKSLDMNLKKV